MRPLSIVALALLAAVPLARAAAPPAAQLLPPDTLGLLSVPDWDRVVTFWNQSAQSKLWKDPSMKAVREKALQKWQDEYVVPLERQLGIKLKDYLDLLHGQLTLAVLRNEWNVQPGGQLGLLLLIDVKDKQPALKSRLAEMRRKWVDSGQQLRTEKIRDVEFTAFMVGLDDLQKSLDKAFPRPKEGADEESPDDQSNPARKTEKSAVLVGQSGPLLIIGNNSKNIERLLARQSGGLATSLAELPAYQANATQLFRDALGIAWVSLPPILENLQKPPPADSDAKQNPLAPRLDKILAASGLTGISTIAARAFGDADGSGVEVFLSAPESRRRGVVALIAPEAKDAGPPPFVASDVAKFSRWRIDGKKAWDTLESMLTQISPEMAGLIQMGLQAAGKERDPNFDLKQALLGSLGDDFIAIQKGSHALSAADLDSGPSLFLVGSPSPEQFVQALKSGSGLMPLAGGEPNIKEREFLGHKIYSLALAGAPGPGDEQSSADQRTLHFAASGRYAAISMDKGMLEEFLRGTDQASKPLRENPGLADAAQKIGGMGTGFFAYENEVEFMRAWLEGTKGQSAAVQKLLSLAPVSGHSGADKVPTPWIDPTLLPSFDKISKYFYFVLYSFSASQDGLSWKAYAPTPPQVR
jgi:hypothetical protein